MERYKISVVVPVYNAEQYLTQCVQSLQRQRYGNLEIVLVDDGSADGSGPMCDAFARQDVRIRVVHKKNGGLVSAWKRGVAAADGDYICFVDSDDWIDDTMLCEMGAFLTGGKREIIASDYVIEKEGGGRQFVFQQLPPGEYTGERLEKEVVRNLLGHEKRYLCISRCMKLISRSLVCKNAVYSDPAVRMGEDMTLILPALLDCERVVVMDHKAYYHYRYVPASMVHRYDAGFYESIRLLYRIVQRVVEDKSEGEARTFLEGQARREYIFLLLLVLKNEARGNPEGYLANIARICREPAVRELVGKNPVEVRQLSNRLLYAVLKKPSDGRIRLLRLAMVLFYLGK